MNFHACAYILLYVYFDRNSVCIIRPAHPRSAEIDRVRGWVRSKRRGAAKRWCLAVERSMSLWATTTKRRNKSSAARLETAPSQPLPRGAQGISKVQSNATPLRCQRVVLPASQTASSRRICSNPSPIPPQGKSPFSTQRPRSDALFSQVVEEAKLPVVDRRSPVAVAAPPPPPPPPQPLPAQPPVASQKASTGSLRQSQEASLLDSLAPERRSPAAGSWAPPPPAAIARQPRVLLAEHRASSMFPAPSRGTIAERYVQSCREVRRTDEAPTPWMLEASRGPGPRMHAATVYMWKYRISAAVREVFIAASPRYEALLSAAAAASTSAGGLQQRETEQQEAFTAFLDVFLKLPIIESSTVARCRCCCFRRRHGRRRLVAATS